MARRAAGELAAQRRRSPRSKYRSLCDPGRLPHAPSQLSYTLLEPVKVKPASHAGAWSHVPSPRHLPEHPVHADAAHSEFGVGVHDGVGVRDGVAVAAPVGTGVGVGRRPVHGQKRVVEGPSGTSGSAQHASAP